MQLRYYQSDAITAFFKFYADGNIGNPLIGMPTGTGKSLVIAYLVYEICRRYKGQRILMLTHVKELIAQNYATLLRVWPTAPAGIYSAGLDRKDSGFPITYAGIASVYEKAFMFQKVGVIFVDEAQLMGEKDDAMYRQFIDDLKRLNPYLIIVGFTATMFRAGLGMLTNGSMFTHIAYDLTGIESFNRLIREGFLAPLIPSRTENELDLEGLTLYKGDFQEKAMEERFAVDKVIIDALEESIKKGWHRKKWLIFASGVKSCNRIAYILTNKYGIECLPVHSNTSDFPMDDKTRDLNIARFKKGEVRALVNNNVLTTGFDCPDIDLIIMLRPTTSAVLWVQMLGRGTRPSVATGKQNCLVLDFAQNTKRLGPINDPVIPRPKGAKGPPREAPVKVCDNCGMYNHAAARVCAQCGYEFPIKSKIKSDASNLDLIAEDKPIDIRVFPVNQIEYSLHQKGEKTPSFRVTYLCGIRHFSCWQCFEHAEPAGHKARAWWRKATLQSHLEAPKTIADALSRTNELAPATHLRIRLDTKHPQIMDWDYSGSAFGSATVEESQQDDEPNDDDIPF